MQGVIFLLQYVRVVLDVREQHVHVLCAIGILFGVWDLDAFPVIQQREAVQAHGRETPLLTGVGSFVMALFDLFLHLE